MSYLRNDLFGLLMGTACVAVASVAPSGTAEAQGAAITVPAMPLNEALDQIAAQSGATVNADPDAIRGRVSAPVVRAHSPRAAVAAAIKGLPLAIDEHDGVLSVVNDIVVVAKRDEAESDLAVRSATTSSRTGQTLREQPRNTQVISGRLLAEQQVTTIVDALRNAGGVSVNTATVQGGNGYSVRGFGAGGIVNGLPSASNTGGTSAGVTQPVANIERIEVLKGPDAMLAGVDNLGGTINIVTKKPYAGQALTQSLETGSFGQVRLTADGDATINGARTLSARLIGVVATEDHNFGGYRGNRDYLLAPSVRFKDANTDVTLGMSAAMQEFGANPYTFLDPTTNRPVDRPRDQPVLSRDQGIAIGSTRLYGDANRHVADWLDLTVRGQHELQTVRIASYSPLGLISSAPGLAFVKATGSYQRGDADAVDGFARVTVRTGPIGHLLVVGATHTWSDTSSYVASGGVSKPINLLVPTDIPPLPEPDTLDYVQNTRQFGQYAQYVMSVWRLKLIAGVRHNGTYSAIAENVQRASATTPNYGAILDVTKHVSLFGNLSYGYAPEFSLDYLRNRLPDIRSRNLEGGVKLDLFGDRAIVNASYFELRQSNLVVTDPAHPNFSMAVPGQIGKGVDLNIAGRVVDGLTVQGSFTRTEYSYLTPSDYGDVVVAQSRDRYSAYLNYTRKFDDTVSGGLGAGLFGQSSAAADSFGKFYVPASRQVDVNAFMTIGTFDINVGLRNVFDRLNYSPTYAASYIPYQEQRNWRLTVGHRF